MKSDRMTPKAFKENMKTSAAAWPFSRGETNAIDSPPVDRQARVQFKVKYRTFGNILFKHVYYMSTDLSCEHMGECLAEVIDRIIAEGCEPADMKIVITFS